MAFSRASLFIRDHKAPQTHTSNSVLLNFYFIPSQFLLISHIFCTNSATSLPGSFLCLLVIENGRDKRERLRTRLRALHFRFSSDFPLFLCYLFKIMQKWFWSNYYFLPMEQLQHVFYSLQQTSIYLSIPEAWSVCEHISVGSLRFLIQCYSTCI